MSDPEIGKSLQVHRDTVTELGAPKSISELELGVHFGLWGTGDRFSRFSPSRPPSAWRRNTELPHRPSTPFERPKPPPAYGVTCPPPQHRLTPTLNLVKRIGQGTLPTSPMQKGHLRACAF